MPSPNLQLLTDAALLLKPLLGELVFVGGCATALLITDSAAAEVRPTYDVDAIADIASYPITWSSPGSWRNPASPRTIAKTLLSAAGGRIGRFLMSCR